MSLRSSLRSALRALDQSNQTPRFLRFQPRQKPETASPEDQVAVGAPPRDAKAGGALSTGEVFRRQGLAERPSRDQRHAMGTRSVAHPRRRRHRRSSPQSSGRPVRLWVHDPAPSTSESSTPAGIPGPRRLRIERCRYSDERHCLVSTNVPVVGNSPARWHEYTAWTLRSPDQSTCPSNVQ